MTSAYTFQVIQILGCTNLGGVYPIFCEVETNMFASSLFGLVLWGEVMANGLRGSLIFIFITKEGEEWWNYNHELSSKDLTYYTMMNLMWDYVRWISSSQRCEFLSYWFYAYYISCYSWIIHVAFWLGSSLWSTNIYFSLVHKSILLYNFVFLDNSL